MYIYDNPCLLYFLLIIDYIIYHRDCLYVHVFLLDEQIKMIGGETRKENHIGRNVSIPKFILMIFLKMCDDRRFFLIFFSS